MPIKQFRNEVTQNIKDIGNSPEMTQLGVDFIEKTASFQYSYNFSWFGRPIIQFPQDIMAMQELIWEIKPDLIIETGIAHGGSLIFSASMLAQLDMIDAIENGKSFDPGESSRKVLGIDIDIREHNMKAITDHPLAGRIQMIQGSSIDHEIIKQVKQVANAYKRVLIFLDSNHTHDHVLAELEAYALLTSIGSYCVVFDTIIEDLPDDMYPNRPWGQGNNPKTAVHTFLATRNEFEIDKSMQHKLIISVAPDGYLKRIS